MMMLSKEQLQTPLWSISILIGIALLFLLPFANKPFHIDDPLFIWAAKHIQHHPINFYGFNVNWYGTTMPMFNVMKNPPMTSYYCALIGWLFGFRECALHLALLILTLACVTGMYYLAQKLCSQPLIAALIATTTPVFILSATTTMCDIMMLTFWIWALFLWMHGLEKNNHYFLFGSGILIAICSLTKYFGISLIPLLFVYSLLKRKRIGMWALLLVVPIVILVGYQWFTHILYGRGLLLDAASYSTTMRSRNGLELFSKGFTGLAFAGGSIIIALFYFPVLWPRKSFIVWGVLTVLFIVFLATIERIGQISLRDAHAMKWGVIAQFYLLAMTGASILGLSIVVLFKCRDPEALLLFLWIGGTFVFASFVNWSVNGRSILPMIPAASIIIARRLEYDDMGTTRKQWAIIWPLVLCAVITGMVNWADYSLANTTRRAATELNEKYIHDKRTVWFQGHWGFQYYMEKNGAQALDFKNSRIKLNDIIIAALNNTNIYPLEQDKFQLLETKELAPYKWVSTMSSSLGAGFYSDTWGPLPFAIGRVPPEKYNIFAPNPHFLNKK
ncbi:MAG: ArnT family glycosyltransferase [bacterium]